MLATRNRGKLGEMRRILRPLLPGVRMLSLLDFPAIAIDESGSTYQENATAKAAAAAGTGLPAIADDSGFEVDALGGEPGVRSNRFAGPNADDAQRNALILRRLRGVPRARRGAAFVCAAAVCAPGGAVRCVARKCRGTVAEAARGRRGFGYDPIFVPAGAAKTFAQMGRAQKDAISHRGKALRAAARLVGRL